MFLLLETFDQKSVIVNPSHVASVMDCGPNEAPLVTLSSGESFLVNAVAFAKVPEMRIDLLRDDNPVKAFYQFGLSSLENTNR